MRRTRLTAAGAAAALILGGSVAAADDHIATQTVTITVEDQALSITATGSAAFTIPVGAPGTTVTATGDPRISYTVPNSGGEAGIGAQRTSSGDWTFGDLELDIALPAPGSSELNEGRLTIGSSNDATGDILQFIPEGADESDQPVTYTLQGTAPADAVAATEVTITFTIVQAGGP